jgi:hypothetical protein
VSVGISAAWRQEMAVRITYMWIAEHGRLLFMATWHHGMTVEAFRANLGYKGQELIALGYGDTEGATLDVTWHTQDLLRGFRLNDGESFRITPPIGSVSVVSA